MRKLLFRFAWAFPLLIMLTSESTALAQRRTYYSGVGVGVGVGYSPGYGSYWGPGYGPYWGGYPGWGVGWMPNYYNGTWGNGLSMYGPPVPTNKPVPGMFGGGDSRFYGLPPLYGSAWMYVAQIPLSKPATLPSTLESIPADVLPQPQDMLPPPKPASGPVELEIRVPTEDALVYIDGTVTKSTGTLRRFNSPPIESGESYTYELRAEWKVDGLTYTHTRRVSVRPGAKVVVELGN